MNLQQVGYNATPLNAAATTQVYTGAGTIAGFFVSSGTSVTVTLYDNTATSGTPILGTFTVTTNGWNAFPAAFATGLRAVIAGTSPVVTLLWAPT